VLAAHARGVIHRDLKPANVMLLNEADHDMVKVLDFGLVKSFLATDAQSGDPEVTQNGVFLGSPQYMAPEQARNVADPRSDVYSLGILVYQMLSGRPPFKGKDYLEVIFQHMKETARPVGEVNPSTEVPREVEAVVARCLQKDPAARYQSMDEVLDALREAAHLTGMTGIFPERKTTTGSGPMSTSGLHARSISGPVTAPRAQVEREIEIEDAGETKKGGKLLPALLFISAVLLGFVVVWLLLPKGEQAQVIATPPAQPTPAPAPVVVAPPRPAELPPATEKKTVRFHVSTEPAGAHVFIGRHDMGTTPTVFEMPTGPDGMANAEMVLVLDGYPTQAITSGGSGDVMVNARLQKKVVMRVEKPVPLSKREEEREREEGKAAPVPVRPEPVAAVARGTTAQPAPQSASLGATAPKPAPPPVPAAEAPRDVVPFGEGMTRPVMVQSGRPITYTREALAARVEGVSIVRCVITAEGAVERCKVIKPLPFMDEPVLVHLQSQRFQPVTYQGKPVSVGYNFSVRLTLPK
jgi:serine/threonine-protein kinase